MSAPFTRLACADFGIMADRLLLPVDLEKCPLEAFPLANGFSRPFGGEIVLLHVLEHRTNAMQVGGRDVELRRAKRHLERLGREHLRPTVDASFRVRVGIPHEEILAEATASGVELILLPVFAPSFLEKLLRSSCGETARNLVVGTVCRVFVFDVRERFNCLRRWADEGPPGRHAA
jgi:nucleotide-binding universal stress UspA family protein